MKQATHTHARAGGQSAEAGTLPPLETDDSSKKSDHQIAYAQLELERRSAFKWLNYSYRHYSQEGEKEFGDWLVNHGWDSVLTRPIYIRSRSGQL